MGFLADDRRHVWHDDGAGRRWHHSDIPRTHHGLWLPGDAAKDSGALSDVAGHVDHLCRRRDSLYLGLCEGWPAASAGQTGLGPAKAGGSMVAMSDSHVVQQALPLESAELVDWS